MNVIRHSFLVSVLFLTCSCVSDNQSRVNRVLSQMVEIERRYDREAAKRLDGSSDEDSQWRVAGILSRDYATDIAIFMRPHTQFLRENRIEARQAVESLLVQNGAMASLLDVSRDEELIDRKRFEELADQSEKPPSIFYKAFSKDIMWNVGQKKKWEHSNEKSKGEQPNGVNR